MPALFRLAVLVLRSILQPLAFACLFLCAIGLIGYSIAAATGHAPWLTLPLQFGETVYPNAGMAVQLALTGLFTLLCAFLPTNARIMALETSHRRFHINMKDVARAYHAAHAADRDGVFQLASEFDSIRERIAFLREHPDLIELEAPLLEVAAQMSHISRELAQVYSDRNVARAQDFLVQRQQEIEDFNTRLNAAKGTLAELRPWLDRLEIDEQIARAQLERLCDELAEILPEIMPEDDDIAQIATDVSDVALLPASQKSGETAEWEDAIPDNDPQIIKLLERRAAE